MDASWPDPATSKMQKLVHAIRTIVIAAHLLNAHQSDALPALVKAILLLQLLLQLTAASTAASLLRLILTQ